MKSLKILIVEDETITAMDLRETLQDAGHIVTAIARNHQQAMASLQQQLPDLALVDIRLAGSPIDGITIAKELLSIRPIPIIYLTAHSEPQTFLSVRETRPAAYLLKPFQNDELHTQVELAYYNFDVAQYESADLIPPGHLFLPINKGHKKVDFKDVIYLQADGAYTRLFLVHQPTSYHISTNLSHLAQYFSRPNFFRLSRSYLINLDHLERLEQNYLYMATQKAPIPIPTTNRKELMKKLTVVRTK